MGASTVILDPVLGPQGAAQMNSILRRFGSYGQYSNEGFDTTYAPGLAQRYDAAVNYIVTGGRRGVPEEPGIAAARTNYVRETYAYGDEVFIDGIEVFRDAAALRDAAVEVHGRPVIEPAIVYANILLPGQELAVHTDVPEFRGANRKVVPQWLLVVMHHSGLFQPWRLPIATGIAYFGSGRGGDLAYYPDGPAGPARTLPARHDTAIVLDTDSVFHGVDRVEGDDSWLSASRPGQRIVPADPGRWQLRDGHQVVAAFDEDELRFSVSWKAYCFADRAERTAWATHADDLTLDQILDTLERDLRRAGVLDGPRPAPERFGRMLIDHHIRFPAPA